MNITISIFFLLSGLTGLIYQVLWAKYLSLVFGNTAQAHTVVLATFLGGLAIGNALIGPRADKIRNRLQTYGWLEIGIGAFALLSPVLLDLVSQFYVNFAQGRVLNPVVLTGLRAIWCIVVILLPTILMGGTLPLLTRFATHSLQQMEGTVSWLYFLNSAGAVVGALLAGFLLIPSLGLDLSVTLSAFINILIGIFSLKLARLDSQKQSAAFVTETTESSSFSLSQGQVLFIFIAVFISGFVSLSFEIAWIRLLSLVLGSSTYSFSLMLAAFISGIALGSWLVRCRIFPSINSYLLFGLAEIGIFISLALTLPLYERLPYQFLTMKGILNNTASTFYLYELFKLSFCFLLMLLPTTFIGMTLPLASRAVTDDVQKVGAKVGHIFSVNTVGNVLGAICTGLFLLPFLGIRRLIEFGMVANFLIGAVILYNSPHFTKRSKYTVLGFCIILLIFAFQVIPAWDKNIMSTGVFRKKPLPTGISFSQFRKGFANQDLLYYSDGSNATVSVVQYKKSGELVMRVNGKPDASSGLDMSTQILLAQIPLLLKPEAEKVLIIGHGSGVTAGASLSHPVSQVDGVEISRAVVEGSHFFNAHNRKPLEDSRFQLHIEDANTFLKLSGEKYDVIISEPSNPWIAGVGNLFSIDFYQLASKHLSEDGVMVQWFHTYEMDDRLISLILRTFRSVFEHTTLWSSFTSKDGNGDYMIVGSHKPLAVDFDAMETRLEKNSVKQDLSRIGIFDLFTFLSLQVAGSSAIVDFAGKGPINSDQYPILEYEAPKAFYSGTGAKSFQRIDSRIQSLQNTRTYLESYLNTRNTPEREQLKRLAEFHWKFGSKELAPRIDQRWHEQFPQDIEPLGRLIYYNQQEGHLELALSYAEKLAAIDPGNKQFQQIVEKFKGELQQKKQSFLSGN